MSVLQVCILMFVKMLNFWSSSQIWGVNDQAKTGGFHETLMAKGAMFDHFILAKKYSKYLIYTQTVLWVYLDDIGMLQTNQYGHFLTDPAQIRIIHPAFTHHRTFPNEFHNHLKLKWEIINSTSLQQLI